MSDKKEIRNNWIDDGALDDKPKKEEVLEDNKEENKNGGK